MTSLPSKDIPVDQTTITNDPKVQPNHVPVPKKDAGFVEEFDTTQALLYKRQIEQKNESKRLNDLYDNLQQPLLLSSLFFIFQLPFINKLLFKYSPSLFLKERQPSFGGYLIKTLVFGVLYFGIQKLTEKLSNM